MKNTTTTGTDTSNVTSTVICKERFPKAYRHPSLDETLTRLRTKAEARNLTKCRKGGVSVPLILGIDLNKPNPKNNNSVDGETNDGNKSASLFMEYVQGSTVRNYLNVQAEDVGIADDDEKDKEPPSKKQKLNDEEVVENGMDVPPTSSKREYKGGKKIVTRVDAYAKKVAHAVGVAIGKMHNVNIIHGDLTTSNIILRNPIDAVTLADTNEHDNKHQNEDADISTNFDNWNPDIVLIDFGLSSTTTANKKTSCHEERAVDLYVLEKAFITTHVGSEDLVAEVMRGYKAACQSSDSVFVRLAQVRLRGRKRECFG